MDTAEIFGAIIELMKYVKRIKKNNKFIIKK
jgi:hypothetical protein